MPVGRIAQMGDPQRSNAPRAQYLPIAPRPLQTRRVLAAACWRAQKRSPHIAAPNRPTVFLQASGRAPQRQCRASERAPTFHQVRHLQPPQSVAHPCWNASHHQCVPQVRTRRLLLVYQADRATDSSPMQQSPPRPKRAVNRHQQARQTPRGWGLDQIDCGDEHATVHQRHAR